MMYGYPLRHKHLVIIIHLWILECEEPHYRCLEPDAKHHKMPKEELLAIPYPRRLTKSEMDRFRGLMKSIPTRREIMELVAYPEKYGMMDDIPEEAAKLFFLQHLYKKDTWQRSDHDIYGSRI
uniref:Uncharacterized protein n=1 Tax=Trichogramma kaykai TaxID=54128 RepID=A0ABD2X200_9HYME